MKTFNYLGIALMAGSLFFTACTKDEVPLPSEPQNSEMIQSTLDPQVADCKKNWTDTFTSDISFTERWNLYGNPQPGWVDKACGREGLFVNNGLYPEGSFAVSKIYVGSDEGYTIESDVCIERHTSTGVVAGAEIGVSILPDSPQTGISMRLIYFGYMVNVPYKCQNKTFLVMKAISDGGDLMYSGDFAFPVNISSGSWHKMQISIDKLHYVSFLLDNVCIWKCDYPLDYNILKNKHIVLGYVSPGNRTNAYHDFVRVSYPPDNK
ncbi:MAG: hypothetical protein HGA37_02055 [Lentimicrobium sp.]|nr:hypothetical protein [Lentimicrobium sp.]